MKEFLTKLLPLPLLYFLLETRDWLRYGNSRRFYSQFGEDIILDRLAGQRRNGTFVDVGAYHPKRYSNTYRLSRRGWRGVNIDPSPFSLFLFNLYRPRDINVLSGVGEKNTRPFFMFTDPKYNTFSPEQAQMVQTTHRSFLLNISHIETRPIAEILEEHSISAVDVLNVDVEGLDLEVLRSIDWSRTRPGIILVEAHSLDFQNLEHNKTYAFLHERAYILRAYVGYTMIFSALNNPDHDPGKVL
jgi:FkbM family methyltransferase